MLSLGLASPARRHRENPHGRVCQQPALLCCWWQPGGLQGACPGAGLPPLGAGPGLAELQRTWGGAGGGVSVPASCSVLPATRPGAQERRAQERRVESRRVESHGSFVFDLLRSFQLFPGWVHTPLHPGKQVVPGAHTFAATCPF